MTPVLFDTNAYSAVRQGRPEAVAILQHAPVIGVSTVTLCELLAGFASGSRVTENRADLSAFLASKRVHVFPVDAATAEHYAAVHTQLRRIGKPIPTNDMLIAATALQHGLSLFTLDGHFQNVPNLRIGASLAELNP